MGKKIFVLDTSVIIYDPNAIKNFANHDVAIPITVLEELDNFKKGNDTKNFAAREFSRFVDKASGNGSLQEWIPIGGEGRGSFSVVMHAQPKLDAIDVFDDNKADHRILNAALILSEKHPKRQVVLVSKDINLRIKAKSFNITTEDYETGKMDGSKLKADTTPTGRKVIENVPEQVINDFYESRTCMGSDVFDGEKPANNHYYILKNGKKSALAYYDAEDDCFERVDKTSSYGISPKNAEQAFALHALLNPKVKLVTVQGVAGTGKTLLSLAAALQQHQDFHHIYLARPIVPLSNKDIGYLPGDVGTKLNPYMEPLWDNLGYIKNNLGYENKDYKTIENMVDNGKIVVCPLAYIRGRSLSDVFFIVDEAQNLTPHEVKTIISRAGENTKMIFTGDVYQVDTPYLDSLSNGLSYLIERAKNHKLYAHITLEKGERSELANLSNELL
ncbi:MAG: PhoH-like ATPase [Saprospiraceae bacterium]